MTKNWWKWALGIFVVLIVVSILVDDPEQDATAGPKQPPAVSLEIDSAPAVVKAGSVTLAGVVRPARAVVEVEIDDNGLVVADVGSDGSFFVDVDLGKTGKHAIVTSARVGRSRSASVQTLVERRLSAAEIAVRRERVRKRRAAAARERERRQAARADREAAKRAAAEERAAQEAAEAESEPASDCDPNYSGCVPIASDVDCAGGSGDGPAYTGPVTVTGSDIYDLDSDSDGTACE
jgi:hypothetical protein